MDEINVYRANFLFWCLIILQLAFINCASLSQDSSCIPLPHCPAAMTLIITKPHHPETIKILRETHCGRKGIYPKLRCDEIEILCRTPDERNGTCVPVKECDPYVKMLRNLDLTDPLTRKYLREFECDCSTPEDIQICCPMEKIEVTPKSLIPQPEFEECGVQNDEDNKVVGGTDTQLDEFPWTALLRYRKGNILEAGCGGSLINTKYVLTAAHCVDPAFLRTVGYMKVEDVVLGEYDTRNRTDCVEFQGSLECAPPAQFFNIRYYLVHPGWGEFRQHDVGLIRLDKTVIYNDYVKPICLPSSSFTINPKQQLMISGWGRTKTMKRSPVKQKAVLPLSRKEKCLGKLGPGQICAGEENGKDACIGDSGGPLMTQHNVNNKYLIFLVGIVSYGPTVCGSSPGVYTYVPKYVDWILETIRRSEEEY